MDEQIKDSFVSKNLTRVEDRKPKYYDTPLNTLCVLACSKSLQSYLTVTLQTVGCQAPLSMGILQARILEWVAIPFSRGSS